MRNLDNFRQALKSPKSWNSMGYICLYLTLLSTAVKIHHISHFSWYNLLYFFSSNITYFDRNIPSKCKFSDFPLPELKFTKLFMSFFKQKVFLQCLDHSSVSWEITLPHFFSWNVLCYWKKKHIKVQIFRLAIARIKIYQIRHLIFATKSQFFFKLYITHQCHER